MTTMHITYEGNNKATLFHEDSGVTVFTDAPKDIGGDGSSFSPTDLIAAALASCIGTTMGMFGARHEVDLSGLQIDVSKEMSKDTPRRIIRIPVTIRIPSGRIPNDQRELFERVAHTCPVTKSLHPDIEVPVEFIYEN